MFCNMLVEMSAREIGKVVQKLSTGAPVDITKALEGALQDLAKKEGVATDFYNSLLEADADYSDRFNPLDSELGKKWTAAEAEESSQFRRVNNLFDLLIEGRDKDVVANLLFQQVAYLNLD